MPFTKITSADRFKLYIDFLLSRLDMLLNFHIQKDYRDLKFTRYVKKQKVLRQMFRKLTAEAGKRTLIDFGGWSNHGRLVLSRKLLLEPAK